MGVVPLLITDEALCRRLAEGLAAEGIAVECQALPQEVSERLRTAPQDVDAVVLGPPFGERELSTLQRLRALDDCVGFVLVAGHGEVEALRRNLSFVPFLGRNTRVAGDDVATVVRDAVDQARQLRRQRLQVAAARARLSIEAPRLTGPGLTHDDLTQLVDQLPAGVVAVDAAARVLGCNAWAAALLATLPREVAGAPLSGWFDEADGRKLAELVHACALDATPPGACLAVRSNGHVDVTVRPVTLRGGVRAVVVLRDASGRVSAEAQRERLQAVLRASEDRLRDAEKMEALGLLAGGIAHDFNNLLTAILAFAEMALADLPPDHSAVENLQEVLSGGRRAAALTAQLLAASRQQVLKPERVRLDDVVADMRTLLQQMVGEHVVVAIDLGAPDAWIDADVGQMQQILMNLAVNARDAMPEGGVLTIATQAADRTQGPVRDVVLLVRDTGVGMDEDTQRRMFEPFFTTKPRGKGTGLGLSVVHGVVVQHHGTIEVESAPGAGTTFRVRLPVQQPPETMRLEAASVAHPPGGSETVLLVEDEPAVRVVVSSVLRSAGYTVFAYGSGAAALAWWRAAPKHPDVLVTDVVMPGMSGPDLTERLRALQPGLRVLFISGYTAGADLAALREEGAAFLQKPFMRDQLQAALRALLDA